ncbi:hypothetical protein [Micromonospora sp. WMMA1947]|uniref:hypothetical protein n=1 Tax=Micromonospora sp. WMMA1947 TaxID=3015163 RepID=UPI00248C6327|nr:hypothetical protein [Micromonospora sp. WMMA1947]WBC08379.1 hypothetical protein O7604_24555 [Micromonospora sp. WMMA1947]
MTFLPDSDRTRRIGSGLPRRRPAGLLLATALATVGLSACGDDAKTPAARSTPPVTPSATAASPTPSPTPLADQDGDGIPDSSDTYPHDPKNIPQQEALVLTCYLTDSLDERRTFTVITGKDGRPDFSEAWAVKPVSCDAGQEIRPVSPVEMAAYKTSGYDDSDIAVLYQMCAEVDAEDVYAEAGFAASSEQVPEINAALTLCPAHPYARKWRAAVRQGRADAQLAAQGRLFEDGTYRVGKEIKPGTYVTTDVDGCYWERQDRSGNTIDNYFTNGARRVQVTIRSSDYAFHSESCGKWRPAR